MKKQDDPLRAEYLELCQSLIEHAQLARNYAMKPGNAWLARGEVEKIGQILSQIDNLLDQIKLADEREAI